MKLKIASIVQEGDTIKTVINMTFDEADLLQGDLMLLDEALEEELKEKKGLQY